MTLELFNAESYLPSQHAEAQALTEHICEQLPRIYTKRNMRYHCKEFLVTVEYNYRGFTAAAVARLENIHSNFDSDYFERKHKIFTARGPRGGMATLEKLVHVVDAESRKLERAQRRGKEYKHPGLGPQYAPCTIF